MNAENNTTDHNRTIQLTGIPQGEHCKMAEMKITIGYLYPDEDCVHSRLDLAIALDNVIIPIIINSINSQNSQKK